MLKARKPITIKKKICVECEKESYIFAKKMCKYCYSKKTAKRVNPISKKHQQTLKAYTPKRAGFLSANQYCQLRLSGCTNLATCIHHVKGKSSRELYLDESNWMASCIHCNNEVERIGAKAYELGLKKLRTGK